MIIFKKKQGFDPLLTNRGTKMFQTTWFLNMRIFQATWSLSPCIFQATFFLNPKLLFIKSKITMSFTA